VTLGVLAVVPYAGVIAYAATREAAIAPVVVTIGVVGLLLLAFVLVRRVTEPFGWSIVLGGLAYAIALVAHGTHVDEVAPLVGAGLLLSGELATWSLEARWPVAADRAVDVSRAAAIGGLCLAGLAVGALVVGLTSAPVGGGVAWTALGAAAAVLVVALAARLARR
jgi:hypothetical protein